MSRQADKQGTRRLGREGHENESMASQYRTGEGAREPELTRPLAEGQEPCGGHSPQPTAVSAVGFPDC